MVIIRSKNMPYTKRKQQNCRRQRARTGEAVGGVAAANEVVRRLRRPELLPEPAPATLKEEQSRTD
jgi:hypothetical protein